MSKSIDQIKANPESYRIYASRVKLLKNGSYWVGKCPFHRDERESLSVFNQDGVWMFKCHAGCAVGNIVQFLAKFENISISAAAKKCEEELASSWGSEQAEVERVFQGVSQEPKTYKTMGLGEYARAEKNLAESKEAQAYLASRGITMETARKLHLGFRQDVGKLAGNGNEAIANKGWIVFPCFEGDKVVSLKYRSIASKAFCRQPGMKTALFNADAIDIFEPVVVTEGEFDVCALAQAGFRAVSIASASTLPSAEEMSKIASASNIYLAGDNDEPGQKAMARIQQAIPNAKVLKWVDAKDANDVLMKRCKGNTDEFRKQMTELITDALVSPMPGVVDAVEGLKLSTMEKLEDSPNRLRFPWKSVDGMAILLPGSVTTVYASQTGAGKSQLCNQVALHNAVECGDVILNYQCELSYQEMYNMITAHVLKKDRNHLEPGDGPAAAEKLQGVKYYIGRDPNVTTLDGALDLIEVAVKHLGVTIVILDHIHHFSTGDSDNEIKAQAAAMQRIKRIAQEYGLKVIIVSQPRKSDQQHERKKGVNISAIKGSEAITSAADFVLGMHRDMLADFDPSNPPRDLKDPRTEIHSLKARAQGTGGSYTELFFNGPICTFFEMERNVDAHEQEAMFA